MKHIFTIIIFVLIGFLGISKTQTETDTLKNTEKIENGDYYDTDYDWEDYIDDIRIDVKIKGNPFVTIDYGLNNITNKATFREYNQIGNVNANIGFSKRYKFKIPYLFSIKDDYFTIGNFSKELYKKDNNNKINLDIWQFGFGWLKGYGYNFGDFQLIPYKTDEILWTRVKTDLSVFDKNNINDLNDINNLELYNESFRFGTASTIGTTFNFFNSVGIDANYKRMVVFPRHMFWYHTGSLIIEAIGNGIIDRFVKSVFASSPSVGPIVFVVFKAAYTYGIYELRKDKMNWPFNTAKPLFFDQFNLGLKFTF